MSGKDVETTEVPTTTPKEAAPVVEGGQPQDTCADLAQVAENMGTQTPPLKGPETSELTSSPTTDSGYAEAASRQESEEGEDQRALCAASLCALSSSPEFQPVGSTPSPEQTTGADVQPEFEGEDMVGTSSPVGDGNVYATPAATPPPAPEGEDGPQTPTGTLSPANEPQLRVSPKRKVETMDLDMDSSVELPALQKKARTGSGRGSVGEDEYQWDNIPPPRSTDQRLGGRFPWGNEIMVMGKPFPNSAPVKTCPGEVVLRDPAAPLVAQTSHWETRRVEAPVLGRWIVYMDCPQPMNPSCESAQKGKLRRWIWIWTPVWNYPLFRKKPALVLDVVAWEKMNTNGTIYPHQGARINALAVASPGEMRSW